MSNQGQTVTSPVDLCPTCRARAGDGLPAGRRGLSLYAPDGAVIRPSNGHPEAPAIPIPIPDHPPAQTPTPEPHPSGPPTQSIHFWQGLAAGLATAVVVLFLIVAVLAG